MIEIRSFKIEDVDEIHRIYESQSDFGIPNRTNMLTDIIAEKEDGSVAGYGTIKLFAEAIMLLDPNLRKREKAEATIKILQIGILRARDSGLEQLHLISDDPEYNKILRNKFGFKTVPGELLMLDLKEDSNG